MAKTGLPLKHWTEPRGILITQVPMSWQYRNPVVDPPSEVPPYSFELYEDSIGCFQLSCYPLSELVHDGSIPAGLKEDGSIWTHSRMDSEKFDMYVYFGAMGDQALIGKYIYDRSLRDDPRIADQLRLVEDVLSSVIVVPPHDRILAASLEKYDRFLGALRASYDLLYAAIEAESYIEIVVVATNQIDAFLRLSIVLAKQLSTESDDIDTKYFFQPDNEKGILERAIFKEAFELGVIDAELLERLNEVYDFRNRVVHRYIISPIKTRDILPLVGRLLESHESVRMALRKLEDSQIGKSYGIYGRGLERIESFDEVEAMRSDSWANDKHALERFRNKIGGSET